VSFVTCREVLEYLDTLNIGEYQFVLFLNIFIVMNKSYKKSKIICFTGVYIL